MSTNINTFDVYKPSISFSISGNNLSDFVLTWSGNNPGTNSKTFNTLVSGPAKFVPVGTAITFTPVWNLPNNNSIIQYKWSFGDGVEKLIFSDVAQPIVHIYDKGLAPVSGVNTCLTATLTAVDQYQQHVRAYKQIYLKQMS